MKFKMLLIAATVVFSHSVFAGNTYTGANVISKISAYSNEESIYPNWRSFHQISTVGALQWSAGGCDSTYVIIRKSDQHMIDLVKLAFVNNKTVIFGADTAVPKVDGKYCLARSISIQ